MQPNATRPVCATVATALRGAIHTCAVFSSEILDVFCPECRGALRFDAVGREHDGVIDEGVLACACGQRYPVIAGVPRLQPATRRAALRVAYPAFFARFPQAAPELAAFANFEGDPAALGCASVEEPSRPPAERVVLALRGAFGSDAAWADARVLDAGCGDGRYVRACAASGARRLVALATCARDADAAAVAERRAMVVEGCVTQAPFEEASFDVVYSVAQFAFAPRPERAIGPLLSLARPGGVFATYWLAQAEGRSGAARLVGQGVIAARVLSGRLPAFARKLVSQAAAPAYAAMRGGVSALNARDVRAAAAELQTLSSRGPERRVSRKDADGFAASFGLDDGRVVALPKGYLVLGRKPVL